MKIYCIFIIFTAFAFIEIVAQNIQDKILNYFMSDTVRSFQGHWHKYKIPMENAVLLALKEIYGHKGMNVYIRKMRDPHKINKGYYHSDNQVQIVLTDLELDNLPHIWMPQVTFPLPSNVLRVDASLSKMIVRSNYVVFRNLSNLIYDLKDKNYYKNSPFTFQQTKTIGQLGIIIEGCVLSGFTVATLNGPSVNLGHDNFKMYNCHHTFEIYNRGSQTPPVFASYYPEGEGLNIAQLLMNPLREDLMPKLQAAMFSYVNSTAIFGKDLPVIRSKQEDIFRETATFLNDVTRNMNQIAVEKDIAAISMDDFKISWDDLLTDSLFQEVKLNKMVLTGLDTAYSSHTGGPISVPVTCISEEIRFERLQVNGIVDFKGGEHAYHNFSIEIKDTAVSVLMELNMLGTTKRTQSNSPRKSIKVVEVTGWRSFEFSASGDEKISIEALVTGYILKILPKYIDLHLSRVYYEAIKKTSNKLYLMESSAINQADEKKDEGLIDKNNNHIDSQDIQRPDTKEELDGNINEETHSVSSQHESEHVSQEKIFHNNTFVTTEKDKMKENEEESNTYLENKNSESGGLDGTDKENGIYESNKKGKMPSEQEFLNSGNESPSADEAANIDKENSTSESIEQVNSSEQDVLNSEIKDENESSNGVLDGDIDEENNTSEDNKQVNLSSKQDALSSEIKEDNECSSEVQVGNIGKESNVSEGNENAKSSSKENVLSKEIKSKNINPSEFQIEDIGDIEGSHKIKSHTNESENKSAVTASNKTAILENNTSRGDSTHLSDNEVKSDF